MINFVPQFRYATPQDAIILSGMAADAFYNTYAAYNTPEDMQSYMRQYFSVERISTELEDTNVSILLAVDNDKVIGYAKVIWGSRPENVTEGKALEIARLYAVTNYIGKGIGKFLMQHCIAYAKEGRANCIWLGVWEQNKKAIRFYEQSGFAITGSATFMLGKDEQQDYIMEMPL